MVQNLLSTPPSPQKETLVSICPQDTDLSSGAPPQKRARRIKESIPFLSLQEPDSDAGALVYDVAPLSAAAEAGVKVGILLAIG